MIRIKLNEEDLSHTRLAMSPLWELVASLCVLHDDKPPLEHAEWILRTRRTLRGVQLGPVADPFAGRRVIPDFVAPIPDEPSPSLDVELELVRTTDPEVIRADIADCYGDDVPSWPGRGR